MPDVGDLAREAEAEAQAAAEGQDDRVDITIGGKAATVPRADLQKAIDAGAEVPGQGLMGSLKAAEVGFGSNVGLGLIPAGIYGVAKHIDQNWAEGWKQNYEQAVTEAQEQHGTAYGLGAMGGMAADMLGPVGKAGTMVEGGVGAASRAFGAGSGLSRIIAAGAGAAATQSLYNAGKSISEDELGDHELNGQKMIASMADKDVLLAGGLGTGFAAAGLGLGAAWKAFRGKPGPLSNAALDAAAGTEGVGREMAGEMKAHDATVEALRQGGMTGDQAQQAANTMDALGSVKAKRGGLAGVVDNMAQSVAGFHGGRGGDTETLMAQYERAHETAAARQAKMSDLAKEVNETANAISRKVGDTLDDSVWRFKKSWVNEMVDPTKLDAARDQVASMLQEYAQVTEKVGETKGMRLAREQLEGAMGKASAGMSEADTRAVMTNMFTAKDALKREMGKVAKAGGAAFGLTPHQQDFRAFYNEVMQKNLEDAGVWGRAAEAQASFNSAFSGNQRAAVEFQKRFGAPGLEANPATRGWSSLFETDPAKWEGYLKAAGTNQGEVSKRTIGGWLDQHEALLRSAREYLDLGKDAAKLADGEKAIRAMRGTLEKTEKEAIVLNRLEDRVRSEAEAHGHGIFGHGMGLGSLGLAVMHPGAGIAGGALNIAAKAYSQPYSFMATLSKMSDVAARFDKAFGGAVDRLVTGSGKAAKVAAPRSRDAIISEIEQVKKLASNPQAMTARLESALPQDLADAAPKHHGAAASTLGRMVSFLAMQAPKGQASLSLLPDSNAPNRYSDSGVHAYEAASTAAKDPVAALNQATTGSMNREAITALKFVYPDIYKQLRTDVMQRLMTLQEKGDLELMPYERRLLLGTLLEITADSTLDSSFIRALQATKLPAAPKDQAGAPSPRARNVKLNTDVFDTQATALAAR
jgi:hypothetical protein